MSQLLSLPLLSPVPLRVGIQKPHAKEPENLWIFRLLDLPIPSDPQIVEWEIQSLSEHGITLKRIGKKQTESLAISRARMVALASWIHHVCNGEKDVQGRPICTVVTNAEGNEFLLQKKDDKHPIPLYRLRYCPFGGSYLENEKPITGMIRELYEEICDPRIVDELCFSMRCQDELQLWTPQFELNYPCLWWVVKAESQKQFNAWRTAFFNNGLGEATPAHLTANELLTLEQQEKDNPGSCFCNNQQELYLRVLHGDFRA
ncbi:TPA: hypothetical protein DDZ01_00680 [Candidatus Uhrbacteria bacterium]|nr:hypothetical protein [Candidatus Uhrbacteria bacterium]HCB56070.1 hypothetical protein [Candidatus Uhrbacteria bacterium]